MLPDEELIPILISAASKLVSYKHDLWELVSEIWIKGNVQKLDEPSHVFRRAVFDAIDYLRTQDGRARGKAKKEDAKYRARICSYNSTMSVSEDDAFISNSERFYVEDDNFERIDYQDELDNLLKGFDRRERLLIKAIIDGQEQKDIGRAIGLSHSRISQIYKNTRKILESRYSKK